MKKQYFAILLLLLFTISCKGGPEYFNDLASRESDDFKKVIPELKIKKGYHVADIGAGGGFFSFKLSKLVGETGRVYSVDVSKESYNYISKEAQKKGLKNITVVLATFTDSKLKKNSIDAIFIRNAYHDIQDRTVYFKKLSSVLKKNGIIIIIDYDPSKLNFFRRSFGHSINEEIIKDEMERSGYTLKKSHPFLKRQSFNIFTKK